MSGGLLAVAGMISVGVLDRVGRASCQIVLRAAGGNSHLHAELELLVLA